MDRLCKVLKSSKKTYANCLRAFSTSTEEAIFQSTRKCLIHNERDGHVVKSPFDSLNVKTTISQTTTDRYIWNNLSKWQNHTAIECSSSGRKYTYAELRDRSAALALRLRRNLHLQKNDIVAICLQNVPEYPIVYLGSIEGGLKVTTINPIYSSKEMVHQLSECRVKAVFCEVSNFNNVKKSCELAQLSDIKIITLKTECDQSIPAGSINFDELVNQTHLNLADASKFNDDTDPNETSILMYSSGTTGLPKGVMHSHKTFLANAELLSVKMFTKPNILPTTADFQDVLPCFLPFFHIYGLCYMLQHKLSVGCKILSMRNYEINHLLESLPKHKATVLCLVPPVVVHLGHHPAVKPSHFETIRLLHSGASTLGQEDAERLLKKAPHTNFIQAYGMTEALISSASLEIVDFATVGFPASDAEMKIAKVDDSSFKGLPANEIGEILYRGPNIMKGYFNNIHATKETITEDGWLRTGDIGYYNENGSFFVIDRLKELIKVNALQVAPAELENILRDHPDVLEAAVVGIPHSKCGEVPKAFVVRKVDSNVTEPEIQEYVAKHVSKHKHLTGGVTFVESVPKTASGKILRREIKRLHNL